MIYYIFIAILSFIIAQAFFIKTTDKRSTQMAKMSMVLILTFFISFFIYFLFALLYFLFFSF